VTKYAIKEGWLTPARHRPSPHCDERPDDCAIDLLVVHGISLPPGEFGGSWIDALFTNTLNAADHPYFQEIAGREVSAHLLIRRDGEVVQYVPFDRRAWHAGQSRFAGRERCNDFSIGIELEGCDDRPYEAVQYRVLADIGTVLLKTFPMLSPERIVGHSDISPGRKTDPGPYFDWTYFRSLLVAQA